MVGADGFVVQIAIDDPDEAAPDGFAREQFHMRD